MNTQAVEKRQLQFSLNEVHSIFRTIQGEGPFAGQPAIFVRLAGCNLQCPGCDTEYTRTRQAMSGDDVRDAVNAIAQREELVVITGGEPFRQDIENMVQSLLTAGYTVQIETNGTLPPHRPNSFAELVGTDTGVKRRCFVVCSPKTGSVHTAIEPLVCAYKYVMDDANVSDDGLPKRALDHPANPVVARPPEGFRGRVYLQPRDESDMKYNRLNLEACVKSCQEHGYTLQLQIHKIIGVE